MDISIGDNHKAMLAERETQLAFLHAEQARLQMELRYVTSRGQQMQAETLQWLYDTYQVAPGTPITLDSARGMLVVPDELVATPAGQAAQETTTAAPEAATSE